MVLHTWLVNKLKPECIGKPIFAQEGTGKTVFTDNETVFDSDYLLAQILEVSPETASFFYNTLTPKQKEAFGNKLKEAIKEKLSQGCAVLTARMDMLNDADVVVYNQNAELTDRRVNNQNRAINQRYSALEYHKNKLDKIKETRDNNENKEYIELGKDDYLGNSLLADPNDIETADSSNRTLRQGSRSNGQRDLESGLNKEDLIDGFLKQFGITINVLEDSNGEKFKIYELILSYYNINLFESMRIIDTQEEEQRNRCSLYKLQCAHRLKYLIEQGKLSTKQYVEEQNRLDTAPFEMKECLSYLENILMRLEDVYFS